MSARLSWAAVLGAAALISVPAAAKEPVTHHVKMAGMKFVPATLTVKRGETVEWKNTDLVPHTVFGPGLESKEIPPGGTFRWTAEKAGKIDYLCSLHPVMHGSVIVK